VPYLTDGVGYQPVTTSVASAESIQLKALPLRERIAELLAENPPMTSEEIARAIGAPYESVQPRLSELRNAKRAEDSGIRRLSRFGKDIIAWTLKKKEQPQ
jgi:predicted HTH transcriptional regulator